MRNYPAEAARISFPVHFPLRKFDRAAPTAELLAPERGRRSSHVLYRFYDADQTPLYIGITSTGASRLDCHRKRSDWWPLAEYVAVSAYRTRDDLMEAERAALRHERPRFNRQTVRGPANVKIPLHQGAEQAAALLFREALPEFVAELAALLAQPERFPQTSPPPLPRFVAQEAP